MYVRWQIVFNKAMTAILVESYRVDGKPRQRHIAYLASVNWHQLNGKDRASGGVNYRAWWWHRMNARLDALGNRIPSAERPKIEAALAAEVPPVTAEEVTTFDIEHQTRFRAEHGECNGCYYKWPPGQAGVPPRPNAEEKSDFANVLAAVRS